MCFVLAEEGLDMTRIKHEVGQYMSQLAQKQLSHMGLQATTHKAVFCNEISSYEGKS